MTESKAQKSMSMAQALSELGVPSHRPPAIVNERFEADGFVNLGTLLSREEVDRIVSRLEKLALQEGENAGQDGFPETGTASLGALINKDSLFDPLFLHPDLLAAVAEIMGEDFGLSSLTSRAALPGEGHQALHWDSSEECAVNALWVLTDFTDENGPTRFVPGSHKLGVKPEAALSDAFAPHPDEVRLIAPAGTVILLNARTWHSGTHNLSTAPRHMASAFFMRRNRYQASVGRSLTRACAARLSEAALFVVDHTIC